MTDPQESQTENVKVVIRVRPLNAKELQENQKTIINVDSEDNQISLRRSSSTLLAPKLFKFDYVFQENSTQIEIYHTVAYPIVEKVFQGYNGTIFAYGQTGTGKTYTMAGNQSIPEKKGIIPNTFGHIFSQIASSKGDVSFVVTATYLEIYNEEVRDLLSTNPLKKLDVRERADIGVYVKNLMGFTVDSIELIVDLMNRGNMNRTTKSTLMNNVSSRSHAIFSISVESKHLNKTTFGKLNLVDLAGSERVTRTQATGDRLREASNINQSLSSLGNVISALVDEKSTHIPYRNSKLTRLLQDSLGGNSKTAMIAMLSPCEIDYEESICTLRYASRVKFIKNNVKINVESKKGVIESFEEEIERLQKRVAAISLYEEKAMRLAKKKSNTTLQECQRYDQEIEELSKEKEDILEKISMIQKKILVGGENLLEKAQKQIFQLEASNMELADLDKSHQELEEHLEEIGASKIVMEGNYSNLLEEDRALDEQIDKIQKLLKEARIEYAEKDHEYQREIENLTSDYRTRMRELQLATKIVERFVPPENLTKIEENTVWHKESNDYHILGVAHAGNNVSTCPLSEIEKLLIDRDVDNFYYNYGSTKNKERLLRLKSKKKKPKS